MQHTQQFSDNSYLANGSRNQGRNDAHNIVGDVYLGNRYGKKRNSYKSPSNYHSVVQRLTKGPLETAENRIVMENKSYDL